MDTSNKDSPEDPVRAVEDEVARDEKQEREKGMRRVSHTSANGEAGVKRGDENV
jgi:hypothetical protein